MQEKANGGRNNGWVMAHGWAERRIEMIKEIACRIFFTVGLAGGWIAVGFVCWAIGFSIIDNIKAQRKRLRGIERRLKGLERRKQENSARSHIKT